MKSLDIVQREINKIMPNDLSQYCELNGTNIDDIRNDIEDADNVFTLPFEERVNEEGNDNLDDKWDSQLESITETSMFEDNKASQSSFKLNLD